MSTKTMTETEIRAFARRAGLDPDKFLARVAATSTKAPHNPDAGRQPARGKPMTEEAMAIIATRSGTPIAELRDLNRRVYGA